MLFSRNGGKHGQEISVKTDLIYCMDNIAGLQKHIPGAKGHPAPFPESLARDHILSWSNPGDIVLDTFMGSGTTAKMARETGRHYIGFECAQEYVDIANKRLAGVK